MGLFQTCDDVSIQTVTSTTWYSGQFKTAKDGRLGVVQSLKPAAVGDEVSLAHKGQVTFVAGEAYNAGEDVFINPADQANTDEATSNYVYAGKTLYAVSSGAKGVLYLNSPALRDTDT
jgi:hypothetical protein